MRPCLHSKPSPSLTARLFGVAPGGGRWRLWAFVLGSPGCRKWKQIFDEFVDYNNESARKGRNEKKRKRILREIGETKPRENTR